MKLNYINEKYNFLAPIIKNKLIRFGNKMDGGYVVDNEIISKLDTFISFGLGNGSNTDNIPWSFENDLIKTNSNIDINIYDHSVSLNDYFYIIFKYFRRLLTFRATFKEFYKRVKYLKNYVNFLRLKNVKFFKEKVVGKLSKKSKEADIKKIFTRLSDKNRVIGLKSDIEGSEYDIIGDLLEYSKTIKIMIIEFHWTDKKNILFVDLVKKIKKKYHIIHIHGNNYRSVNSDGLPIVLEITFLNKDEFDKDDKLKYNYNFPINNLDYPCDPSNKDISFSFKEF